MQNEFQELIQIFDKIDLLSNLKFRDSLTQFIYEVEVKLKRQNF